MVIYIVVYTHRHGIEIEPFKQKEMADAHLSLIENDKDFSELNGDFVEIIEKELV
jgi:hypothetical protein